MVDVLLWIFGGLFIIIGALIGVIWGNIKKELKDLKDSSEKNRIDINSLKMSYAEEFGLVNANISETREQILNKLRDIEVNSMKTFVTKEECKLVQRLKET